MASGLNMSGFMIPRLGADNYQSWAQKVSMLLRREGLWACVNDPPDDMTDEQNEKALATIVLTLEDRELVHVRGITSARRCWMELQRIHVRDSIGSQIHLTRKLFRARLEPGGDLLQHLETVKTMLLDLRDKDVHFQEDQEVFILLSSLDASYDTFVSNLEVLPRGELTMSNITSRLLEEAQKRKDTQLMRKSSATVLQQPEEMEEERAFTARRRCYACGSTSHLVKDCGGKRGRRPTGQKKRGHFSHLTMSGKTDYDDYLDWIIDSGSSVNICHVRRMFTDLKQVTDNCVVLANNVKAKVEGQGMVYMPQFNRRMNMLYVPTLKHNLLSVSKLTELKCEVTFKDKICQIKSESGNVLCVKQNRQLYVLQGDKQALIANVFRNEQKHKECIHVWHKRLGHANYKGLRKTIEQAMPVKVNKCNEYVECTACILGKSKQCTVKKTANVQTNNILDLVSLDLVGPMPHASFGGARYILTIQDQHSRFTFCYVLKDKTQTAGVFESWLKFVERKSGVKLRKLQSDNAMEFKGEPFQRVVRKYGLYHRFSAPYCPTQNAYIERRQQTLQNMIQTVLEDSKLSPKFWAECALYSCHTMNVTYHSSIGCSPYEIWTGRKPVLNNLHAFGAPSYVVTPLKLRKKCGIKAKKMFFVGYQSNRKAMRFADESGRIVVSASAKIDDSFGISDTAEQIIVSEPEKIQGQEKSKGTPNRKCIEPSPSKVNTETKKEEDSPKGNGHPTTPILLRRTGRQVRAPERYSPSVNFLSENGEPQCYDDLKQLSTRERKDWLLAVDKELKSLEEMNVYEVVPYPEKHKVLGCRWIFKKKCGATGDIRYRARLVAKGYLQTAKDYDQVYSPTLKAESLRAVLTYAASKGYHLRHIDIECAYLHSNLDHEIYMEIPPGVNNGEEKCWRLKKSLYGLKQSAFQWNSQLTDTLLKLGFQQGQAEPCLFVRNNQMILCFVDDILVVSPTQSENIEIVKQLQKEYKLRDLGEARNYLGIEIETVEKGFKISQKEKIAKLARQYNMMQCKGTKTPMILGFDQDNNISNPCDRDVYRSLIGSLLYISQWTRPDISMAVNYLSQFNQKPLQKHWQAAKWIIRYLLETQEKCLYITPNTDLKLNAYADANYGTDPETRKSNSGIAIYLGNVLIHWKATRQHFIALSSAESEMGALSTLISELVWFRQLVSDMKLPSNYAIDVFEDNQATIALASNNASNKARSKHIDIRYKHVKQAVAEKLIQLHYCESAANSADCLTKILGPAKHEKACELLGVM